VLKSVLLSLSPRLLLLPLCVLLATGVLAQKRKKKKEDVEPIPQVLAVIPDPPDAVATEPQRLSFQVSPLSAKGLLSQQVHDALKAIGRLNHGVPVIKLRAFVAGSGDLRRVKEIIAEDFAAKKQTLPAVTTIQVGALPLAGAQVAIEAASSEKKVVNPSGIAFLKTGETANAAAAVMQLQSLLKGASIDAQNVLRVSCFLNSLDDVQGSQTAMVTAFPSAAANFVQMQRLGLEPQVLCEAAARLTTAPAQPLVLENGLVSINAPKLVLTATQLVFRDQDSDFRLAYQRLAKTLASVGATFKDVFWTGTYVLTRASAAKIESLQWEFLDRTHPPAHTGLQIEGLPSTDATAAIEVMAVGH